MVKQRVKNQAKGQNDWSRGLKWAILHFCSSNTFGDTTKNIKIWVFQFLHLKKVAISLHKIAKNEKIQKQIPFCIQSSK